MYEIGQKLTNDWEVSDGQEVVVEILDIFADPDDGEINFIIKCREAKGAWGWYTQDELDLRSIHHLDKYWRLVKD